jgi:uncharacterized protein (DUF433 family)
MVGVSREHIQIVQGARGPKPRIVGSRIRVQDIVVWHEKLGMSADQIVQEYPTITVADVYAALAYYWDHRDEMERAMAEDAAFVEDFRRRYPGQLQERIRQRQSQ